MTETLKDNSINLVGSISMPRQTELNTDAEDDAPRDVTPGQGELIEGEA